MKNKKRQQKQTDVQSKAGLELRLRLMNEMSKYIKSSGLSQVEIAKHLGVAQPRVSNLVRGQYQNFSLEFLISLLERIGIQVDISIKAA